MDHLLELAFQVEDVSFVYNDQILALDHISLQVRPGEKVAILGSNGSGKSTLLKILDGLYFPTGGRVTAFGQGLSELTLRDDGINYKFRSRVGFVFQDSEAQLFMPTVWEEIAFAPLQLDLPHPEVIRRVEEAMQSLEIDKLRDRAPHQLSGGEKKRVALASILSLAPDVWLLDEPSAGLDPRTTTWLVEFLNGQHALGKTIVTATHDLGILEAIADRVYVIDEEHRLIAQGSPQEVLANRDLLVAANLVR
jgi:cobalt/nickel transport system ATP-binding protein